MSATSGWMGKSARFLRDVAVFAGAGGTALGILGTLAYPWTEPYLSMPVKIEGVLVKMEGALQRLGQVELAVDELRPPTRVAIFDDVGSSVFTACGNGVRCEGQYKVKRTDIGLSCGKPDITGAFVINHGGRRWAVSDFQVEPVRADDEWVTVPFSFVPPSGALPGTSRFFFSMEYRGCAFAATGVVVENTLKLPFIISEMEG